MVVLAGLAIERVGVAAHPSPGWVGPTGVGVLIAGGQHADHVFDDVFLLGVEKGELHRQALPPLPHPLTMSAGVVHVTAVGAGARCKVEAWETGTTALVRCTTPGGAPVDATYLFHHVGPFVVG